MKGENSSSLGTKKYVAAPRASTTFDTCSGHHMAQLCPVAYMVIANVSGQPYR
jgi:hypothetical protein